MLHVYFEKAFAIRLDLLRIELCEWALYNPGELSILTINFLVSLGNRPGKSQKLSITSRRSTKLNNAARGLIRPIGNLLIKRFAHHNMKYL